MGKLKIEAPKNGETALMDTKAKGGKEPTISKPYRIIHTQHVSYDAETRSFVGLPPEWRQVRVIIEVFVSIDA
jgi:hypothetical protein